MGQSGVESPRELASPRELNLIINNLQQTILLQLDMIKQRLDLEAKARELQASEYERRLDELNHAHEIAKDKEHDFVLRDYYDSAHSDLEKRQESFSAALIGLQPIVGRMDAFGTWREEVIRIVGNYQSIPVQFGSLASRVDAHEKVQAEMDKRLTGVYSYGAGAMGVLIVFSILINIAVRFIFKS